MPALDAIILAGGIPVPDDPIYAHSQGLHKSLIDIGGKPMVQWVIDALDQSSTVSRLMVIGLDQESRLSATKPLSFLPDSGGILENVMESLTAEVA